MSKSRVDLAELATLVAFFIFDILFIMLFALVMRFVWNNGPAMLWPKIFPQTTWLPMVCLIGTIYLVRLLTKPATVD